MLGALLPFTDEALKRSRELLFGFLTPEQQSTYSKPYGYFDVVSWDGKRKYRMRAEGTPQYAGPRAARFGGWFLAPGHSCCIHMLHVPWDDYNLACAMLLSSKEGERYFHSIANW